MKNIFKQPTIKWASLIVLVLVVTFFACKRTTDVQANNETFNAAQAKEWYYGEFKKSSEFKNSLVKGKQLPNWEKGTYRKEGDLEIVDFPLLKNNTTISVLNDKSVTSQGIHQIINASLKKIAFIKKPNNEIIVRELDYVPFWDYLETKGFDISNINFGGKNNDFTGMVTVKKWGGAFILRHAAYNGKFYKKTVKTATTSPNSQQTNSEPCPLIENCTYTITCEFELHGDVWVNTGICDDPVKGDCEPIDDPNCPPPNGGGGEEDPCAVYGVCGGGGGEDDCSRICDDNFSTLVNSAQKVSETEDFVISDIDNFKKRKDPNWTCHKGTGWILTSKEEGVVELIDVQNEKWRWVSLEHKTVAKTGLSLGGTVEPLNDTGTPSFVAGTDNVKYASMRIDYSIKFSPVCDCPIISSILTPTTLTYINNSPFWNAKP